MQNNDQLQAALSGAAQLANEIVNAHDELAPFFLIIHEGSETPERLAIDMSSDESIDLSFALAQKVSQNLDATIALTLLESFLSIQVPGEESHDPKEVVSISAEHRDGHYAAMFLEILRKADGEFIGLQAFDGEIEEIPVNFPGLLECEDEQDDESGQAWDKAHPRPVDKVKLLRQLISRKTGLETQT